MSLLRTGDRTSIIRSHLSDRSPMLRNMSVLPKKQGHDSAVSLGAIEFSVSNTT
ncbi:MAG: hypothetical protein HC894_08235 [Microcoleus sp. SM1_3_4]|nr:hypothetical protein [Microcoleus sp. SM1_3_4]